MRLYLDACSIIYAVEGLPQFRNAVSIRIAQAEAVAGGVIMTSRLSRLECRVKPMRDKQAALLGYYDSFFVRFLLAEITEAVVDRATELRAAHNFKTPDALHLATALEEHADLFLTGDANLTRCPGLKIELI